MIIAIPFVAYYFSLSLSRCLSTSSLMLFASPSSFFILYSNLYPSAISLISLSLLFICSSCVLLTTPVSDSDFVQVLLMLQLSDSQLLFVLRRFASLVFSLLPNILTLYHIPLVLLYPKYPKIRCYCSNLFSFCRFLSLLFSMLSIVSSSSLL